MNEFLSVFRSQSGEKLVLEAYDNLMTGWSVPYEDLYLNSKLGTTHIIVSGKTDAPPLFLIHAFYASAVSWYQNVKRLSADYRVHAVDIIGDPNKSKPFRPIRQLSFYVDWLKDLMDQLHVDRADFIGNSVGAFHVANFALNEPERVRSMILIGPASTFVNIPAFYINTFPGGMTGWGFLVRHAVRWIENGAPLDPGFHKLFYLLLKNGKSANQVFPFVMTDRQLKQIQTPTLLIYGEKEVIYDYSLAIRRAEKCLVKVKIEIIPGANHITAASQPAYANEAILRFLSSGF
jgi:pimeloyl-ACP methyl ester carboxylesterase